MLSRMASALRPCNSRFFGCVVSAVFEMHVLMFTCLEMFWTFYVTVAYGCDGFKSADEGYPAIQCSVSF
jgi:hypothetical protein